jgi:hypothetical protein
MITSTGRSPSFTAVLWVMVITQGCAGDEALGPLGPGSADGAGGESGSASDPGTGTSASGIETGVGVTEDDGSDDGGATTEDSACGDKACGADAPEGWLGPIVVARVPFGAAHPTCEALEPGPILVDGFVDPGPAMCTCRCEAGAPSEGCMAWLELSTANDCSGEPDAMLAIGEPCVDYEIDASVHVATGNVGSSGTCERVESDDIPPFAWASTIVTCRLPDDAQTCDGGSCRPLSPPGFDAQWCVFREGDLPCPAGGYAEATTYWTDVNDTRGCTTCQCGFEGESCAEASLTVYAGAGCGGSPIATIGDNACGLAQGGSIAVHLNRALNRPVSGCSIASKDGVTSSHAS